MRIYCLAKETQFNALWWLEQKEVQKGGGYMYIYD